MDALLEENIIADYVIGVSAGIAYGTSYVSRQIGRNLELSVDYMHDKRYMGVRHLFNPKNRSYYNKDFAFRAIPKTVVPFDYDAFAKSNESSTTIAVLTNLNTGKPEYHKLPSDDWDRHTNLVWASCALPIIFQPEEIDGQLYMDGGISDPIPFQHAIDDGCDKIITILTRERSYSKFSSSSEKLASRIYRKYPDFSQTLLTRHEKYNKSRERIFELSEMLINGLLATPKITLYTPKRLRNGIISFNVDDLSSSEVCDILSSQYDVCARCGLHCAPLIHKHLGTLSSGTVRISVAGDNTFDEAEYFLNAIREIAN